MEGSGHRSEAAPSAQENSQCRVQQTRPDKKDPENALLSFYRGGGAYEHLPAKVPDLPDRYEGKRTAQGIYAAGNRGENR